MMGAAAFATRRLSILLNRFGWIMALLWVALITIERNDRQSPMATPTPTNSVCVEHK